MNKHYSNSQLKVDGNMTKQGADRVGFMQALALNILAVSALLVAVAGLIWVLK